MYRYAGTEDTIDAYITIMTRKYCLRTLDGSRDMDRSTFIRSPSCACHGNKIQEGKGWHVFFLGLSLPYSIFAPFLFSVTWVKKDSDRKIWCLFTILSDGMFLVPIFCLGAKIGRIWLFFLKRQNFSFHPFLSYHCFSFVATFWYDRIETFTSRTRLTPKFKFLFFN